MSMFVKDIKEWLDTLPPECSVGVAEEGLSLVCDEHPNYYLEIGGLSEDEED